ncbi:aspartic peptidase domain-containing protein [Pyrenochaeta sp. MPI-SDFR-AT-0127]|nr:aspartic peptidase domain-containing protein [Pyrenochaeta sp. MPI-SDFR-AT-0127]
MRPATPVLSLTFLILHVAFVQAEKCTAPPLNLPIRSVSIAPGTLSRGIPISIGTPYQQIALVPSLQVDNTFVPRYTKSCTQNDGTLLPSNDTRRSLSKRDSISCAELYGGGFDPSLSSTFRDNGTNDQIREDWFRRVKYSNWHFVTERFTFGDYLEVYVERNEVLPGKRNLTTTFMLPDDGSLFGNMSASALGLTPKSTLMKALHDGKIIPSTSWSLTNESLCLGCIDENSHRGDFKTFKPADRNEQDGLPCLLQTKVEALNYHPDAQTEGATVIDKTFNACIDPGITFLVLPPDARQNLPGILNRDVLARHDDYTVFKGPPKNETGILTFKFEGGFAVNITVPGAGDVDARETGSWKLPIGKGAWGAYGEDVPVLGRPFTDHVVLRWDEIAQEYGMANMNSEANKKESLKPLGCEGFPTTDKTVQTTPRTSIIVGSILGGFAGGLLFAAAGVFFFRRGQRGVTSKYEPMRGEDAIALRVVSEDGRDSRMSGALPAPSIRESVRSHFRARSISPMPDPQLVEDGQIYEAPEGGTAYPSKRERGELQVYAVDHR